VVQRAVRDPPRVEEDDADLGVVGVREQPAEGVVARVVLGAVGDDHGVIARPVGDRRRRGRLDAVALGLEDPRDLAPVVAGEGDLEAEERDGDDGLVARRDGHVLGERHVAVQGRLQPVAALGDLGERERPVIVGRGRLERGAGQLDADPHERVPVLAANGAPHGAGLGRAEREAPPDGLAAADRQLGALGDVPVGVGLDRVRARPLPELEGPGRVRARAGGGADDAHLGSQR
jgi:hypothetical protein